MRVSIYEASEDVVKAAGGKNIKVLKMINMIFADLEPEQIEELKKDGYTIKPVAAISASSTIAPPPPITGVPTYTPADISRLTELDTLRTFTDPPLFGENLNIAMVDTGVRETHQQLAGHVVYSKNYTDSPMEDGYGHGTSVASVIAAVAPKAGILNLKVLGSDGSGSEEDVAMAIDDCIDLWNTNPDIAPTIINVSVGSDVVDDVNTPIRVACRAALDHGIFIFAAAGNSGPNLETILSPACERYVSAVGSCVLYPFTVSDFSSRGPTPEGLVKPDIIMPGDNITMADRFSDTATVTKSGTSFAAPFASSIMALFVEAMLRHQLYPSGIPAGIKPSDLINLTPRTIIDAWDANVSVKPQGVSSGKDNAYGWGMPIGNLILEQVEQPVQTIDIGAIMTLMVVMMMLGSMSKIK